LLCFKDFDGGLIDLSMLDLDAIVVKVEPKLFFYVFLLVYLWNVSSERVFFRTEQ